MKLIIIISLFFSIATLFAVAQTSSNQFVIITLKNNSLLPKKCTVISYSPGENGNGTQILWVLPNATKKLNFKEGTKLYLANQTQVNTVMSGKRIDKSQPFLTVKKEDSNQVFKF